MFERPLILTSPPTMYPKTEVLTAQKMLAGQNAFNEDFHPGAIDGVFGQQTAGAIYRCKYLLGFPPKLTNHAMGETLYNYLKKDHPVPLPPAYQAARAKREVALKAASTKKNKAFDIATSFIGVHENPPGTNRQQFGDWYGYNGVAWCCIFVTYCEVKAGNTDFERGKFASYVNAVVDAARYGHRHLALTSNPEHGDLVDYNYGDHIEFFDQWQTKGSTFYAVGGNTSGGNGSYNNGGEVARNLRYMKGNFPVTHFMKIGV